MLPTTSHRTERVLDRLAARTRPPRQTPLQPRDKRPHYELRHMQASYDGQMSQAHDTMKHRELEMAAWLTSVAREKKRLYQWTTDETIDHSSIDRATWYRWKKLSKYGHMPSAPTLAEFCESLGLDPSVPFRILGYTRSEAEAFVPEPDPVSDIDRRIQLLMIAIDRPGIPREEQRELEVRLVRLRAAKEASDEAMDAADEALKRHRAS